jgi:hypothetical protein
MVGVVDDTGHMTTDDITLTRITPCPLATEKGYEGAGGCGIVADGSDCSMSGIASGCIFLPSSSG